MLLAYIDESYDDREYWITALVVPNGQVRLLQERLEAVAEDAQLRFPGYLSQVPELHGHALAQGTEDWAPMSQMIRARLGIYGDALDVIANTPGLQLVRCGVDRLKLTQRYSEPQHPHDLALKFTLERVHARCGEPGVLVTCDDIDHPDRHRANLDVFRKASTGGLYPKRLTHIVDTLHFSPSNHSRLLQAADLVSYIQFRVRTDELYNRTGRAVPAAKALWDRVRSLDGPSRYLWP